MKILFTEFIIAVEMSQKTCFTKDLRTAVFCKTLR